MGTVHLPKGSHIVADFWGCENLKNIDVMTSAMVKAAQHAGATVLGSHIHHFGEDGGVTGVVILAESHISVHTWPEHNYAAFDVFVCGDADAALAIDSLIATFTPDHVDQKSIGRGWKDGNNVEARHDSSNASYST